MIPRVTVIGTVFIDCKGFAKQTYYPLGRNLGNIQFVHGGVGRNVVENLANLGLYTTFVSSVDGTGIGKDVISRLAGYRVNVDYIEHAKSEGMGMWMAILNEQGDLAGSISQMPNLSVLEGLVLRKGQELIDRSSHIVLELDLNEAITRKMISIAKSAGRPVYGIPGNLDVILSNPDVLSACDCFICNEVEAERLMGSPLTHLSITDMQGQVTDFAEKTRIASLVVTLGAKGAVYYDAENKQAGYQGVFPVEVLDSSGAGDAFFSGTVMGLIRRRPLQEAVKYGAKVAAWTIQSSENTCRELSAKMSQDAMFSAIVDEAHSVREESVSDLCQKDS